MSANSRMFWKVRAIPARAIRCDGSAVTACRRADGTGRGTIGAGDDVEGRGLAGAVGADDADDLARRNLERKVGEGVDAAKQLGDAVKLKRGGVSIIALMPR